MNIKNILVVLALLMSPLAYPCGEVTPPPRVTELAIELAYPDFPKVADILAIGRIESRFILNAINKNAKGRGTSNGVMQVNGGPFELRANMEAGVDRLRTYYLMIKKRLRNNHKFGTEQLNELNISKIAGHEAVKAYNIGIGNYFKGKMKISAADYFSKYIDHREVYENYPEEIRYIGKHRGCYRHNPIRTKNVPGHASGHIFLLNEKTGGSINPSRKV